MNAPLPVPEDVTPAPGGRWRGFIAFLPMVVWFFGGAGLIAISAAVSKNFRTRGYGKWIRLWGRVPLICVGIKLEVHGRENLERPGAKLVLFNHLSQLDLFILASMCTDGSLVLYKKEFDKLPGIGSALRNLGMIPVDRKDLVSAIASVTTAGQRILQNGADCFIAPEGTRSRDGKLQPFKKGAFHLAASHGIPIVPMVMRGVDKLFPMGLYIPRSGTVRVDYLEPIDTSEWDTFGVRKYIKDVRDIYLQYVPGAPKAPKKKKKKPAAKPTEE
jgi:putative phosphoserine phosphatase/1-acylglycerol-3-phosphate O-acyltransferase